MRHPSRVFAKYFTFLLAVIGLAALSGLSVTLKAQVRGCVDQLYQVGEPRGEEYRFDVTFDRDPNGQSFSCDLGMRASDARDAIEDFRYGVAYDRKDYIAKTVAFPLSINEPDKEGKMVRYYIRTVDDFMVFKNSQLNKMIITMIGCSNVRNVDVLKGSDYAVSIGGRIWFANWADKRQVRVVSINNMPTTAEAVLSVCTRGLPR